jgi:hypothetical protein
LIYTTGGAVTLRPNFDRACLQGTAVALYALWLARVRAG